MSTRGEEEAPSRHITLHTCTWPRGKIDAQRCRYDIDEKSLRSLDYKRRSTSATVVHEPSLCLCITHTKNYLDTS